MRWRVKRYTVLSAPPIKNTSSMLPGMPPSKLCVCALTCEFGMVSHQETRNADAMFKLALARSMVIHKSHHLHHRRRSHSNVDGDKHIQEPIRGARVSHVLETPHMASDMLPDQRMSRQCCRSELCMSPNSQLEKHMQDEQTQRALRHWNNRCTALPERTSHNRPRFVSHGVCSEEIIECATGLVYSGGENDMRAVRITGGSRAGNISDMSASSSSCTQAQVVLEFAGLNRSDRRVRA